MNKFLSKLIVCIILVCCTINSMNSYAEIKVEYNSPSLKNVKGYEELKKNLDEIKRIRKNVLIVNINTTDTEKRLNLVKEKLNYHIVELRAVKNNLNRFKGIYSNSKEDVLFAEQLSFIATSYELSLNQQISLIEDLIAKDPESTELFFSDGMAHIYYYLTLGDQMVSYIDNYYNLRK